MRLRTGYIVVWLLVSTAASTLADSVATEPLSGVRIEYESPLLVSRSHALVRLNVHNASGRRRTWTVESGATQYGHGSVERSSRFELTVADGEHRSFELLLPMQDNGNGGWMQMRFFGYGIRLPGQSYSVAPLGGGQVAVSEALGDAETAPELARALGVISNVSVDNLPDDWRVFDGFDTLWLTAEEWERVDASSERAVLEWVARGHKLVLVAPDVRDPVTPYGLGAIVTVPLSVSPTDEAYVNAVDTSLGGDSAAWASRVVDRIETREGLLSLVLLGYLLLVGPVNLLVFAPRGKRLRLFWTMPSIALGASGVLAGVIVLQDGLGGTGRRAGFVYLMPELKRELVVQEQVSRTGALLSRRFELDENVVLTDVAAHQRKGQATLRNAGSTYDGDWFRSRSVQVQRLGLSRPSRARIEWVDDSDAPRILSSIEDPLERLFYRDAGGELWHAENVLPGHPTRLSRSTEAAYTAWRQDVGSAVGPRIAAHLETAWQIRGTFVAAAEPETSNVPIETLRSIDWQQDAVLYAGRLERAER